MLRAPAKVGLFLEEIAYFMEATHTVACATQWNLCSGKAGEVRIDFQISGFSCLTSYHVSPVDAPHNGAACGCNESIKAVQLDRTTGHGERSLVAAAHGSPACVALKEVRHLGHKAETCYFYIDQWTVSIHCLISSKEPKQNLSVTSTYFIPHPQEPDCSNFPNAEPPC